MKQNDNFFVEFVLLAHENCCCYYRTPCQNQLFYLLREKQKKN